MPRKFRLGRHRKNEFRKRRACTLTVQHVATVTQHSHCGQMCPSQALLLPSRDSQPLVGQGFSLVTQPSDGQVHSAQAPLLPSGDSQSLVGQRCCSEAPSGVTQLLDRKVDTMPVSVPLTRLLDFEMLTVSALRQRIGTLSVLQHGMYFWVSTPVQLAS